MSISDKSSFRKQIGAEPVACDAGDGAEIARLRAENDALHEALLNANQLQRAAEDRATAAEDAAEPMLRSLDIGDGGMAAEIAGPIVRRLAMAMAVHFRASGATNYIEMGINAVDAPFERYTVTVQRYGAKSAHMLRAEAEAERNRIAADLAAARADAEPLAREVERLRAENARLHGLLDVPADLQAVIARASQGIAYTSGPPWFRRGDVVLVGSPDPHAGTIIADCDPVDMRHDYREAGRKVLDAADDATVLAAAWNRLMKQAAALAPLRPSGAVVDEMPTSAGSASGDKRIVSTAQDAEVRDALQGMVDLFDSGKWATGKLDLPDIASATSKGRRALAALRDRETGASQQGHHPFSTSTEVGHANG